MEWGGTQDEDESEEVDVVASNKASELVFTTSAIYIFSRPTVAMDLY